MNKLKVGIMPRRQFQRRMLDIAAGKIEAERDAPKVWFSSIQSLSEARAVDNRPYTGTVDSMEDGS